MTREGGSFSANFNKIYVDRFSISYRSELVMKLTLLVTIVLGLGAASLLAASEPEKQLTECAAIDKAVSSDMDFDIYTCKNQDTPALDLVIVRADRPVYFELHAVHIFRERFCRSMGEVRQLSATRPSTGEYLRKLTPIIVKSNRRFIQLE